MATVIPTRKDIDIMLRKSKEFLLINLGLILTAVGIVLFKEPDGFAIGGVSGIAVILNKYFPGHNVGLIMFIINIILNLVGLIFLGRDFGVKTVYSSFALSFYVWAMEKLAPLSHSLSGDMMLDLMFAIILPAVGSALVFNQNSSTGGTDIVAMLLTKYTHIHVGKTLLIADFFIASSAIFTLGVTKGMYSVLGLVLKGFIIDMVVESLNISKKFEIITACPEKIEAFILEKLHRGTTLFTGQGGYSGEQKKILTVVLSRSQAVQLRNYIREVDPNAFMIIVSTSEIIGNGFRHTEI